MNPLRRGRIGAAVEFLRDVADAWGVLLFAVGGIIEEERRRKAAIRAGCDPDELGPNGGA